MNSEQELEILKTIQKFLEDPTVIIWGSGATIPYGVPSMDELKEAISAKYNCFSAKGNLESELGKIDDPIKIREIKKIVRERVVHGDTDCLNRFLGDKSILDGIRRMIAKFYATHPKKVDIVTTNYDRILEYVLSKNNYDYTDGFTGRSLSRFDEKLLDKGREIVNLIKVHGSLNWFRYNNEILFSPIEHRLVGWEPEMILPSKNKYAEAHQEPYRSLLTRADEVIEKAESFLVVGFGFNDEHLTPKIEERIKEGTPIVIATKEATDSCKKKLNNAVQYCLLEKSNANQTKVTLKKKREALLNETIDGQYWHLDELMNVWGIDG